MIISKAKAGSPLSYKGYNFMLPNLKKNWHRIIFLYSVLLGKNQKNFIQNVNIVVFSVYLSRSQVCIEISFSVLLLIHTLQLKDSWLRNITLNTSKFHYSHSQINFSKLLHTDMHTLTQWFYCIVFYIPYTCLFHLMMWLRAYSQSLLIIHLVLFHG